MSLFPGDPTVQRYPQPAYTPLFRYAPLLFDRIRLIELLPTAKYERVIECRLYHCPLSNPPPFAALSYCWGSSSTRIPIFNRGTRILVTENLFRCLFRIRNSLTQPRLLWIDAVCINQGDVIEKTFQVQRMQDIYRKADEVIVWLGDNDYDPSATQQLADTIRDFAAVQGTPRANELERAFREGQILKWADCLGHLGLTQPFGFELWGFAALIRSEWFSRVWIVQEICLARKATVWAGSLQLDWRIFSDATRLFINGGISSTSCEEVGWVANRLLSIIDLFQRNSKMSILHVLLYGRCLNATHRQDKVFALCGLSREATRLQIACDYKQTVVRTYGGIALALLQTDRQLDFLSIPKPEDGLELPSWIPDWSKPSRTKVSLAVHLDFPIPKFRTSKSTLARPQAFNSDWVLTIDCMWFDTLSTVCRTLEYSMDNEEYVRLFVSDTPYMEEDLFHELDVLHEWASHTRRQTALKLSNKSTSSILLATMSAGVIKDYNCYQAQLRRLFVRRWCFRLVWYLCSRFATGKTLIQRAIHVLEKLSQYTGNWLGFGDIMNMIIPAINRGIGHTTKNYLGLFPRDAQIGDQIFLAKGSKAPLLLRPTGENLWTVVGDCYVHGIMYGEAFDEDKCQPLNLV